MWNLENGYSNWEDSFNVTCNLECCTIGNLDMNSFNRQVPNLFCQLKLKLLRYSSRFTYSNNYNRLAGKLQIYSYILYYNVTNELWKQTGEQK